MQENPVDASDSTGAFKSAAARIGGLSLHIDGDSYAIAARARAGLQAKFEREADPDGTLAPEERARRVELVRRRHYARVGLKAAKTRRTKSRRAASSR